MWFAYVKLTMYNFGKKHVPYKMRHQDEIEITAYIKMLIV